MAVKPYYTSNTLIDAIKRKISFPSYQSTFSSDDLLAFANEEMLIAQVPNVMSFHEEYFVFPVDIPLKANKNRYNIPNRAIALKLRDLAYVDSNNNIFEMTRINSEDKSMYSTNYSLGDNPLRFYIEGNEIVIVGSATNISGKLTAYIFLRPNQLVLDERAAIISSFNRDITISDYTALVSGVSAVTIQGITFIAVSGSPSANEFLIDVSNAATAANLSTAIANSASLSNISTNNLGATVTVISSDEVLDISTGSTAAITLSIYQQLACTTTIPSNITAGSLVDLLQTKPGHRTYAYDIKVPSNGISGSSILLLDGNVPRNMTVGDYVCSENECIIPQIPPDLHNALAERACARVLEALGDQQGLQNTMIKITDIEQKQGTLLSDRVDGSPQKITARHSLLKYTGFRNKRFF